MREMKLRKKNERCDRGIYEGHVSGGINVTKQMVEQQNRAVNESWDIVNTDGLEE